MTELQFHAVTLNDLSVLRDLSVKTFSEKFEKDNLEQNLDQYLKTAFNKTKLKEELSDENVKFYFAKSNDEVLGYLKLNKDNSQNELTSYNSVELERIYVLKAFQGQKIGQRLLDFAIKYAKDLKAEFIWLGVWEHNSDAIRFYTKNGFKQFDSHFFWLGNDKQTDIMMKLEL